MNTIVELVNILRKAVKYKSCKPDEMVVVTYTAREFCKLLGASYYDVLE